MPEPDATRARSPFGGGTVSPLAAVRSVAELFQPPAGPDEIGRIADYRILKPLGEGGMGSVYLAEDTKLNREVALKFLLPSVAASQHGKVRFLREARAAAGIRHENVIVIYQVDEVGGVPFIAMERLKGFTLDDWVRKKGVPPLAQSVRIVREMLAGLHAAHEQGLVHRDIKPANVWLEAPKGKVRLLDFGLAVRSDGDQRVTQAGAVMGTPAYMSPEQAHGQAVDLRSDLFSVGVVLYRLCTGKMPFTGDSQIEILMSVCKDEPPPPRQLNPDLPAWLDALVVRLLAKDPAGRPASAADAIKTLSAPLGAAAAPAMDVPPAASGIHPLVPATSPSRLVTPVPRSTQAAAVPAPAPVPAPVPLPIPVLVPTVEVYVDETESDEDSAAERRRARERARARQEERDERARRFRADMLGVGATLLGLGALGALFLIAFNKHGLALPLALGGLACAFFARGQTRVNALVLNVLATAAAVGVLQFAPQIRDTFDIAQPGAPAAKPGDAAKPGPAAPAPAGALEVEFDDANVRAGLRGFALFVGGRQYPLGRDKVTALAVPSGAHVVEVRYEDGIAAYTTSVAVRPRDQGKATVRVPKLDAPDEPGTLEIRYQPMPAAYWEGVQMFVDDKPVKTGPPDNAPTHTLTLARGAHTLRYVRNGDAVYTTTVTVQRPGLGPTAHAVNLLQQMVVAVTLNNPVPIDAGVDAYVEVDGKFVKDWPAGTRSITFNAFAGPRVIEVKTRKPLNVAVLTIRLTLPPGAPYTFDIPSGPPRRPDSP
jgi:hypothetical protein